MSNWNLLVVDECHNCTGNSSYVNLLNNYYHKTKPEDQPRVLGLTASPLINVKKNHSDQQLDDELARLEKIMDARIVSLDDIGLEEGDEHKGLWLKEADEKLVRYEPTPPPLVGTLPDADNKTLFQLHSRRRKEFRNFTTLYNDVGAFPLGLYARHLLEDLSRNTYENESANQFLSAQQYIRSLVSFSEQECIAAPELGLSSKLLVLEALLQREIEGNSTGANKAVCVVFVQRRITALALKVYFSRRLESKTNGSEWPPFHQPALKGQDNHRGDEALRFNKNEATCAGRENYQYTEAKACPSKTEMADAVRTIHEGDGAFYQFEDADPDDDPYFFEVPYTILTHSVEDPQSFFSVAGSQQNRSHHTYSLDRKELIRCDVLVRKPNQLFKSLNSGVTLSPEQEGEVGLFSVHRERDIRRVINGLRSREINVLIATSIVEEGVDVQACSFVAVFDDLQTIKSYIQMKGRARMEGAKFFVLQTRCPDEKSYLSLEDAKAIDLRVRRYICSRRSYQRAIATTGTKIQVEDYIEPDLTSLERSAVKSRLYRAK